MGSEPTSYPELNALLAELVARMEAILEQDLVGAYLTGSFALGAGDLTSDCDFIVVTENQVKKAQEHELRSLHPEIPRRVGYWPHNLEGSYAPRKDLLTLEALGGSGCTSTAACRRWSGPRNATPRTCAGRSESGVSRSPALRRVSSPRFPRTPFAAGCAL
jgi:hypothetical protein